MILTECPYTTTMLRRDRTIVEVLGSNMSISLRTLTPADIDEADTILMPAYGVPRSRKRELALYLSLQPDGWRLALDDGRPIGMGGATDFGTFAYIGLMAVHPDAQRRGIATLILEDLLGWLKGRDCSTALLDASAAGAPLYVKYGFVDDDKVVQFQQDDCALRPRLSDRVVPLRAEELDELVAYDTPIFGANRIALFAAMLAEAPRRAFLSRDANGLIDGYLFAQPSVIGPWAARDAATAEALLGAVLELSFEENPRVLVPGANTEATGLLLRYGFSPQRSLRHMRLGDAVPRRRELIYGQASFGLG
ncbi:MAG TPA: GNAT family N-acetyltransferase, partial [Roseiflexaceae bacterium]|nr:GNAT family N-acetyltransferase [Roseiflexaceae bacterium]